ncbi:hypothetical protein ColLi_09171 [Colletotrichum liriopes]|uniref:Uncharacterized protein n=1 Tax=Colletotrichum liriopes TaxID=708192 RepID=A0AA37GUG3_9PEZI|nr:hypothetical protein ColLi_09171 [Colletotrichum liriopes]
MSSPSTTDGRPATLDTMRPMEESAHQLDTDRNDTFVPNNESHHDSGIESDLEPSPPSSVRRPIRLDDADKLEADILAAAAATDAAIAALAPGSSLELCIPNADLSRLRALLPETNNIPRFAYNFATEIATFDMGETILHQQIQLGMVNLLLDSRDGARRHLDQEPARPLSAVANRLGRLANGGSSTVENPGRWVMQPDFSLYETRASHLLPSLVGVISYSQCTNNVKKKAVRWMEPFGRHRVHAVLIVDVQYPEANQAGVSLFVADHDRHDDHDHDHDVRAEPYWAVDFDPFYIEGADAQPDGAVELFTSDLLGSSADLPDGLIRPRRPANKTDQDPISTMVHDISTFAPYPGQVRITFAALREVLETAKEWHFDHEEELSNANAETQPQGAIKR